MLMSKYFIVALLPFVVISPGVFEVQGVVCVCLSSFSFVRWLDQGVKDAPLLPLLEEV